METREGIAVSPGIGIAPAFPLESEEFVVSARPVAADAVENEVERFQAAVDGAAEEIAAFRESSGLSGELKQLFDAHAIFLQDRKIHDEVVAAIREEARTAEYCVRKVFGRHADRLAALPDEYFAERARDVRDIEERILRRLTGQRRAELEDLPAPVAVIARDLTPTQTAAFDVEKVRGIAVDVGGRTSHTAIVARSLSIPAVVGMKDLAGSVREGTTLIVDGNRGRVIVDPDPETLAAYERLKGEYDRYRRSLERGRHLVAETLDGYRIRLLGNIERPRDAQTVVSSGGDGVGLFRTEFLFDTPGRPPTEDEHYEAYRETLERLEGRPLVVRTFDLGGDKIHVDESLVAERNPFMGLRSLRYCLSNPGVFLPQLRGILRAAVHGDVRLLLPMVSAVEEVRRAREFIEQAKAELTAEGREFRDVPVGIMVEIPAAAVIADLLAKEVSFFSVGTNDLIQFTMAVDRGNERVGNLYQPAHPAVLRLLSSVIRAGTERGLEVTVCGEICSEPIYTLPLLGMGLREMSLAPGMIPEIKKVIRSVTMERAREVALTAVAMGEAATTERYLHASLRQILPMLF